MFHYQGSPVPGTYSELTSVAPEDFPTAIALRSTVYVDPDPTAGRARRRLTTRVFLRNQNRPPVAYFTVVASGKKITINASMSEDPEGNALRYEWLDNGNPIIDPNTGAAYGYLSNSTFSFNVSAAAATASRFASRTSAASPPSATRPARSTARARPRSPAP